MVEVVIALAAFIAGVFATYWYLGVLASEMLPGRAREPEREREPIPGNVTVPDEWEPGTNESHAEFVAHIEAERARQGK